MCIVTNWEDYNQEWEDYFAFVNTNIYRKLLLEDELYIAYGFANKLEIEDIRHWYKDAEAACAGCGDPIGYIENKYGDFFLDDGDVQYLIDKETEEGALYEQAGYWFST